MFVGVMNFGQNQKLRFEGVKNFRSCSTMTFGHLHSVKLTRLTYSIKYKIFIQFKDQNIIFLLPLREEDIPDFSFPQSVLTTRLKVNTCVVTVQPNLRSVKR